MAKQRLKKMVITVTPQTAYHRREMAGMCHYKSVGRVVDKLMREKWISMNAWRETVSHGRRTNEG